MNAQQIIKQCVERAGSIRKLADRAGYPHSSVAEWVKGTQNPRFNAVVNCVGAVGMYLALMEDEECTQQ